MNTELETQNAQPALQLGVVILAAGGSTRMGRPKLLLPWGVTTVLGHLVAQWRELGAGQIAVVCATGDTAMLDELDQPANRRVSRIFNPQPELGMFSSIRCAAQWTGWEPDLRQFTLALGDQPHLRATTLRALVEFAAEHPDEVCQPARSGRPRHPVLLPSALFRELRGTTEENLRDFLKAHASEPALCTVDDRGLDLDMDSPADYAEAKRLAGLD